MIADKPTDWQVRDRKVLGKGWVSNFVNESVVTPSGEAVQRQYLTHPGAVAVVAWDEERDQVVVLRQYRHPVRMELVEVPAGLIDADDVDWVDAARRELAEEVELGADDWRVLVDFCTTPGSSEESLRVYLARGLSAAARPDGFVLEGEEAHMTWDWVARAELTQAVFEGRCQNPSLVVGVLALEAAVLGGRLDSLRPADAPWPIRDQRPA
ncbi:NUDIX hydrolase [Tessaracoccus rhinocerotis]|uniref:NUDIX hydrolase n=1 Tax=Tessaracoccus rhinocerotis TaxID=1689449 RepID=A0A553JVZ5_9ACTN|nr:NUDIX hydrolase [Tessaracoccus rhinocerotis]TRY16637.1 NUDIX hydrolase [Tessaracoccus rhinocerotis]